MKSEKPELKRLVGTAGDFGEQAGLTNDWAARTIRLVGNYGEVFERNFGAKSPLGIPRDLDHLWTMGGNPICSADPLTADRDCGAGAPPARNIFPKTAVL